MSFDTTRLFVFVVTGCLIISGCSTNSINECPIPDSCAPLKDVYESAVKDDGSNNFTTYDRDKDKENSNTNEFQDEAEVYDVDDIINSDVVKEETKKPVKKRLLSTLKPFKEKRGVTWHPPKTYSIWLAHWVDSDEILHSGSYVWLTTKGYWTIDGIRVDKSSNSSDSVSSVDFSPALIGGLQKKKIPLKSIRPNNPSFVRNKAKKPDTDINIDYTK